MNAITTYKRGKFMLFVFQCKRIEGFVAELWADKALCRVAFANTEGEAVGIIDNFVGKMS